MALAGAPSSEHAEELLTIARRSAARMRRLIEDLLAYASVGAGSGAVEPVDLDAVLTDVLSDLAPSLSARGVTVERSEEHTSELQSLMRLPYAVFCLKKTTLREQTPQ